jgi:hypothetical protein
MFNPGEYTGLIYMVLFLSALAIIAFLAIMRATLKAGIEDTKERMNRNEKYALAAEKRLKECRKLC